MSLAGQPARIGGIAATLIGWMVLVLGFSVAVGLLLLLQSIWPASFVGWAFAVPIAVVSSFVGLLSIFGGKRLKQRGVDKHRAVQREAVSALVAHHRAPLSAAEVADRLGIALSDADTRLTELATEAATEVRLEVGDDGSVRYDFSGCEQPRFRVSEVKASADADEAVSLDAESSGRDRSRGRS